MTVKTQVVKVASDDMEEWECSIRIAPNLIELKLVPTRRHKLVESEDSSVVAYSSSEFGIG
jgi:hypothetical protein